MYLLEAPTETISDVLDRIESPTLSTGLSAREVQVDVPGDRITLGTVEVPLGSEGLKSLASWLDVPNAFLLRQPKEFQQQILSYLLGRSGEAGTFVYDPEHGLDKVFNQGARPIAPEALLRVASRVIDSTAPVRDFVLSADALSLDVFVPESFDHGVGGDVTVGDVSYGGLRILQDRKHNLAPQVMPFQYRPICTNGMVTTDYGLKVDARGASVEEVLADFERIADLAFRRAEADITAFYETRSQVVENPERTLLRVATEAHLPSRTITRMLEEIPAYMTEAQDAGRQFSMFDVTNIITNEANNPAIRSRVSARRALQEAGGGIVTEHAARCGTCQSLLTH